MSDAKEQTFAEKVKSELRVTYKSEVRGVEWVSRESFDRLLAVLERTIEQRNASTRVAVGNIDYKSATEDMNQALLDVARGEM